MFNVFTQALSSKSVPEDHTEGPNRHVIKGTHMAQGANLGESGKQSSSSQTSNHISEKRHNHGIAYQKIPPCQCLHTRTKTPETLSNGRNGAGPTKHSPPLIHEANLPERALEMQGHQRNSSNRNCPSLGRPDQGARVKTAQRETHLNRQKPPAEGLHGPLKKHLIQLPFELTLRNKQSRTKKWRESKKRKQGNIPET